MPNIPQLLVQAKSRGSSASLAKCHTGRHNANCCKSFMGRRDTAPHHKQVSDSLRDQATIGNIVSIFGMLKGTVGAIWMMKINRIACNSDAVVKSPTSQDVLSLQHILANNSPGLSNT